MRSLNVHCSRRWFLSDISRRFYKITRAKNQYAPTPPRSFRWSGLPARAYQQKHLKIALEQDLTPGYKAIPPRRQPLPIMPCASASSTGMDGKSTRTTKPTPPIDSSHAPLFSPRSRGASVSGPLRAWRHVCVAREGFKQRRLALHPCLAITANRCSRSPAPRSASIMAPRFACTSRSTSSG